jgi:hypothetical protein
VGGSVDGDIAEDKVDVGVEFGATEGVGAASLFELT